MKNKQNNFLNSILGKSINSAIDIGIRTIFPDFIESQIISLKDNLLNYGFRDGINQSIKDSIEVGKSFIGIITGEFDNITQMNNAIKKGGIIDSISNVFDFTINKLNNKNIINNNVSYILKNGKNIILNNIENNIEKTFKEQNNYQINIEKNISDWKKAYDNKDFKAMEKSYCNIEKDIKKLTPIKNIIEKTNQIENLHNLIKNNGQNFNLTEEQIELTKML